MIKSLGTTIAALLIAAAVLGVNAGLPAAAQEGHCELDPVTLQCRVVAPVPGPGGGGGGVQPRGGGSGGGGGRVVPMTRGAVGGGTETDCTWQTVTGADADQYRQRLANAPSDGSVQICDSGVGEPEIRIAPEGAEAEPPPDPALVAAGMLAEAQAQMRAPQVVADPPVGTPSIITLPVFIQVTNWVDGFEVGPNCVQGVCVTLTAEPTLTFDPGEPGSEPIVCDPPGTRFDPNGADPAVQAEAPGACAYAYQARTGADDRPEEWQGVVTVTWNVAWTAGEAGDEFPPYPLSTAVPREVDEVQTVVRD
jgi:hypothetical protein